MDELYVLVKVGLVSNLGLLMVVVLLMFDVQFIEEFRPLCCKDGALAFLTLLSGKLSRLAFMCRLCVPSPAKKWDAKNSVGQVGKVILVYISVRCSLALHTSAVKR